MLECNRLLHCNLCPEAETCAWDRTAHNLWLVEQRLARIQRRVLVTSNKGGVGKSTVAANLAAALALQGERVGLADVDISGPSQPVLFGLGGARLHLSEDPPGLAPAEPVPGLKLASIAFLLGSPDEPIVWRDAYKFDFLQLLFGGIAWGDLDWLILDMPPGTGGELIATQQLLAPIDGALIVTTPQAVALADARRAVGACTDSGVPVLGLIENMSGLACPHCGGEIHPFSSGGAARLAAETGLPLLGQIPLDPATLLMADAGLPAAVADPDGPVGQAMHALAGALRDRFGRPVASQSNPAARR